MDSFVDLLNRKDPMTEAEIILQHIVKYSSDVLFIVEALEKKGEKLPTCSPQCQREEKIKSIDFYFREVNPIYQNLFPEKQIDFAQKSIMDCLPDSVAFHLKSSLMTCFKQQKNHSYQHPLETPQGLFHQVIILIPIVHSDHLVHHIVGLGKTVNSTDFLTEEKYRNFFENAVAGIYQTTSDGQYQTVNPMLARLYGYDSPQDLIENITDIAHQLYVNPERRELFRQIVQKQGAIWGFESQIYRKDGSIIWIAENGRAIGNEQGELIGFEGTVEDVTPRKKAEEELHRRERLLQGVALAMQHLLKDNDHYAAINKSLEILGNATQVERVYIYENHRHPQTKEALLTLRFQWLNPALLGEKTSPSPRENAQENLANDSHQPSLVNWSNWQENHHIISDYIKSLPLVEQQLLEREKLLGRLIVPIHLDKKLWGYLGFYEGEKNPHHWSEGELSILMALGDSIGSVLQRQKTEALIRYQALHDRLTGLPNRILLNEKLSQTLQKARHGGNQFALLFLDLDYFKEINDSLGHGIGDLLLQSVAKRLTGCLREGDLVARWGGDEFIMILPGICHPKDAGMIGQRIIDVLQPDFDLAGHQVTMGCSIGIALYPRDGEDGEELMKKADMALYRAKNKGRNNYQL